MQKRKLTKIKRMVVFIKVRFYIIDKKLKKIKAHI